MTTMTKSEVEAYVSAVDGALGDLAEAERAALLEDLPEHLLEVLGEGAAGTLRDRLGDPADYAAELRAAAGYGIASDAPATPPRLVAATVELGELLDRAGRGLVALLHYDRLIGPCRALQPGWWVLRGWIVALMITGKFNAAYWTGYIPRVPGGWPVGVLLIGTCVAVSAWVGRHTSRGTAQTRAIAAIASIVIAVFGIFIARNLAGWEYASYYGPQHVNTEVVPYAPATTVPPAP